MIFMSVDSCYALIARILFSAVLFIRLTYKKKEEKKKIYQKSTFLKTKSNPKTTINL